ncbi:hypothetical protein [Rhabdochlamydiaceae symbiont of Dictyostelium giganteum]|uniref:hypothetical protein n=1 Tax=Rhabdochlamydiaceae symbiont of Dictyostelium giganteum TaxID=3342349 RepID=UPI00384AD1C9
MFNIPFKFYRFTLKHRGFPDKHGFLLESSEGRCSEISPLPGRSTESLKDVYDQLKALQEGWKGPLLPSVEFGLYGLQAPKVSQIRTALLLKGTPEEVLTLASHHPSFEIAKLKIGDWSLEESVGVILTLSKTLRLRLDFNDQWTPSLLKALCEKIPSAAVEFLEDPPSPKASFPVAYDKKIRSHALQVYKPMVFGLPSYGSSLILSSSFESSLGLEMIASLTLSHGVLEHTLGLGTLLYLEDDLVEEPATFHNKNMHFPDSYRIKTRKLFSPLNHLF